VAQRQAAIGELVDAVGFLLEMLLRSKYAIEGVFSITAIDIKIFVQSGDRSNP